MIIVWWICELIILMSFLYFGNVPASVPPTLDTTPCMKEMLQYEDCVFEYRLLHSAPTCRKRRFSIPTGPLSGQGCSLMERQSRLTPRTSSTKILRSICTCARSPKRTKTSFGSAKRSDSSSRHASENWPRFSAQQSIPVGTLHRSPHSCSRDFIRRSTNH